MKRFRHLLLPMFIFISLLTGGLAMSGEPRPGSAGEFAAVEMRRIEKLAADPKADPDKLWQELVDFRRYYPAQPQALRAAELMSKVRSPLDALDRKQVPEEERLPWLPAEVVAVLGEHRGRQWAPAMDVRLSPDGRWILGGPADVRVWDAATLCEHKSFPEGICGDWSEDGKVLAVGGRKHTIRLYAVGDGDFKETAVLVAKKMPVRRFGSDTVNPNGWVQAIGLTSDHKHLVAISLDNVLRIWDLTGKEPNERAFDEGALGQNGVVLPGARRLLCEGPLVRENRVEPGLVLWDVSGEKPRLEGVLRDARLPAALAPDGRTLATAGGVLWDIGGLEPKLLRQLPGDFGSLYRMTFSRDGSVLFGGQNRGHALLQIPVNEAGRKRLGLAADLTHFASDAGFCVASVQVFPDGKTLVLGGWDGTIRLWDLAKDEAKSPAPRGHLGPVAAAAFSPDGKTLITGGRDRTIRVWRLDRGRWQEREVLRDLPASVSELALSPDGKLLAASFLGNGICGNSISEVGLWPLSGGGAKEWTTWRPHSWWVLSIAFSADGGTLVTSGSDRRAEAKDDEDDRSLTVRLWNLETRPPLERLLAVPKSRPKEAAENANKYGVGAAYDVALSPDGKLLACAASGAARVWKASAKEAEEWAVIKGQRMDSISCVAISPDGKTLATSAGYGGDEKEPRVRLWDLTVSPPRQRLVLKGGEDAARRLDFSGDGKTLFACCDSQPIRWDVASGRRLEECVLPRGAAAFALAPDGRHLVTCNANGTAYIFRLAPAR